MATITKIIDSDGTPGVNCDFTTIDDWGYYVSDQSNPDQVGIVRGYHSYPSISLSDFTAFATATTQFVCPRLIADPSWQAGYLGYSGSSPSNVPFVDDLIISGAFDAGNMRHFKVQGLQTGNLSVSLSANGTTDAGIWFDSLCVGTFAQFTADSSSSETPLSAVRLLFTNCLFIGDGSPGCFSFNGYWDTGVLSVAFVHSVIAKAASVNRGGTSSLLAYVINSVQMSKEGYGFVTNATSLAVAGNASYSPDEGPEQLNPVFSLDDPEYNYGIFLDSSYYASDYRLPAGSPLIDLGVTPAVPGWDLTSLKDVMGTARPRGGGFDIGLYEYPSAIPETSGLLLCF